jgi:hypothetical protein
MGRHLAVTIGDDDRAIEAPRRKWTNIAGPISDPERNLSQNPSHATATGGSPALTLDPRAAYPRSGIAGRATQTAAARRESVDPVAG